MEHSRFFLLFLEVFFLGDFSGKFGEIWAKILLTPKNLPAPTRMVRSPCNVNQGRIQPVRLGGGGRFQWYLVVKTHTSFATVREIKYTSQHCCDKTMDDKNSLISRMFFSELYKIMVNKVTFVGFRGAIAPIAFPLDPHPMWAQSISAVPWPWISRLQKSWKYFTARTLLET